MKKLLLFFVMSGMASYLFAQVAISNGGGTLKDITPTGVTVTSEVAGKGDVGKKLTSIGKNLIFTAKDATNGEQVWVYNGTDAPSILKKIGTTGCDPNFLERSLDGTKVFFSATDSNGSELWVTDGTAGGTKMVQNLNPAGGSEPDMITAYKSGVLFRAKDVIAAGQGKSHLFYSDGNTITSVARVELRKEGDTMWKDIQVTYDGKKAFFVADDGTHGYEMWCYDGTAAQMVLDIGDTTDPDNAEDGSTVSTKIEWPIAINNVQCLFRAQTPATWLGTVAAGSLHDINEELWVTDGTADGTYLLGDWNKAVEDVTDQNGNVLYQRTKNTQYAYPVILKGMVMARADDGVHGVELCAFDNIPYADSKTKSRHVVDMNGVGSDGSNGATWTEGNAVWNGIWISFLNHDWR
jgi:ELWxxDGT repeat protein